MNDNIICPSCNREISTNNKFCPYCGGKLSEAQPQPQMTQILEASNGYQLLPGTMLKVRYRIEHVIDEGDNYISYIADDVTLQIKVVVNEFYLKEFLTRDTNGSQNVIVSDESAYEKVQKSKNAYLEETRERAKLSGFSGMAEVRDYFEQNGTAYMVMEWLNGGSLQSYIDRNGYTKPDDTQRGLGKRIPFDVAIQMMEPVIHTLEKMHEAGILHGDICPENMAFNSKGSLKLLHATTETSIEGSSDKTVMLNMGYAPMERYHTSGTKGPWSDVYSLCATIYKCITGMQPIEAGERAYQDTLKKPSELGIEIDRVDEAALMMGLAVNVEKRFSDMKVLHKALYREGQPRPMQSMQTQPMQQPNQRPMMQLENRNIKGANQEQTKKKTNIGLIIGLGIAAVMLLAVVLVGAMVLPNLLAPSDKSDKKETAVVEKEVEKEDDEEKELGEEELAKLEAIDEQAEQDASYTNQKDVLEQYYCFAVEYEAIDEVSEQVEECFDTYKAGILGHVQMLESQEVIPAMYIQMKSELDTVTELGNRFEELDIEVDISDIEEKDNALKVDYKQRLIDNFDSKAIENINNNGVISRSVLWAAMENADQTGLYDETNLEDPLRLRYVAALTFHTDSELTGIDTALDTSNIYNVLEKTDYSPLLLYYLSYNYGDDKAKEWYAEVNGILSANVGDFDSMSMNDKKNLVFYLNANSGNYASTREQIREYMQQNFVNP